MFNRVKSGNFDAYLQEARSWETDRVLVHARSRRLAWIIAAIACIVAALAVTSTMLIAIKDPPQPTILRVNESTGAVDVLSTLQDRKTNYSETINKYFVQWYVRYREGYSRELAEEYYSNVGLMSGAQEQQRYYAYFNPSNPQSPLNLYGPTGKVRITIKSISFIQPMIALVRYTRESSRSAENAQVSHWAATLSFRYAPAPMSERDRAVNPLGFQVIEYRNDADSMVIEQRPASVPTIPTPAPMNGPTLFPQTVLPTPQGPVVPAIEPGQ